MARTSARMRFPHSLWDRLTNPDLIRAAEDESSQSSRMEKLKQEVRTHLEWLLNTRCCLPMSLEGLETLESSLVAYGLPDISSLRSGSTKDREQLEHMLEDAIRRFEPRLDNVRVDFNPSEQDRSRSTIHYRVSAVLKIKPFNQPVLFDTVLEVGSKSFMVRGDG
ncbi:MAG: type VI secretion system baseplate subunit TssE [Paludisphaera borealis]|uniref:type VI secretion system baseplate subunit TssE n=1 Tax=Paludisphaera borealis TaxID=1387353 RepID=UPI00283E0813|nr:type VI secretion system baseplate subunit TssE [Paludisphaera borealis]MDR3618408.1 type VI secretion system baseplate subunit TssE [Paludisphaera borealis]